MAMHESFFFVTSMHEYYSTKKKKHESYTESMFAQNINIFIHANDLLLDEDMKTETVVGIVLRKIYVIISMSIFIACNIYEFKRESIVLIVGIYYKA